MVAKKTGYLPAIRDFLEGSSAIILFFVVWEALSDMKLIDPVVFPPLHSVIAAFSGLLVSGKLLLHVSATLNSVLFGFVIAFLAMLPIGILMAYYKPLERRITPLTGLLMYPPPIVLVPLFIFAFGLGLKSQLAAIFWACWPITLVTTISAMKNINPIYVKVARSMNTSGLGLLTKVIIPASLPDILPGARLALSRAVMVTVSVEMITANVGIGFFILNAEQTFRITDMYAMILASMLIGMVLNYAIILLEKKLCGWRQDISSVASL